jgi:hypothetical protein
MYLWDINGEAAAVALSGDVTIRNAGVVTIETDAVTTAKILDDFLLAADIATDAVTTAKIFRRTILPLISQMPLLRTQN